MSNTNIYHNSELFKINNYIKEKCKSNNYIAINSNTNKIQIINLNKAKVIEQNKNNITYLSTTISCETMCHAPSNNNIPSSFYIYPNYTWISKIYPESSKTNNKEMYYNYCSSNYTLLSALSMCKEAEYKSSNNMMWYNYNTHYFLQKKNTQLFNNMHFATIETLHYAKKHYNFIDNLLTVPNLIGSNKYKSYSYNDNIVLNQGLGCGNLISSNTNLANVLVNVLNFKIKGISKKFIQYYITPLDASYSNSYKHKDIIHSNIGILEHQGIYTTGLWQYFLTEYPSFHLLRIKKYKSFNFITSDRYKNKQGHLYWGHEGMSYGISSFLIGGYDLTSKYIISVCSTINIENGYINDRICELVLKTLVVNPKSKNIDKICIDAIQTSYKNTDNPEDSYDGLNMDPSSQYYPLNYEKPIHFSLSYIIYNISSDISNTTNITFISNDTSWNYSINGDLSNKTFIYGSCGSKLCTALNTIIMINDICHNAYDNSAELLFTKLMNTPAYYLLNSNVLDYNLYTKILPYKVQSGKSYPSSYNISGIGFNLLFSNTFYKNNINNPAYNTGWLTLKRLIYMNTPLNDFDAVKSDTLMPAVPCTYNSALECRCYGYDYNHVGKLTVIDNSIIQSIWLGYSYGPFQWLQMANTCDISNSADKGIWNCNKEKKKCVKGKLTINGYTDKNIENCNFFCKNPSTKYCCNTNAQPGENICIACDGSKKDVVYNSFKTCLDKCK